MRIWFGNKRSRLIVVITMSSLYGSFLIGVVHFLLNASLTGQPLRTWLQFGVSVFVALIFLAVAAFVWLFARQRSAAALVTGLCGTLMVTFCVQTAAARNEPFFSAIGNVSSLVALPCLATLVLLFPQNHLRRRGAATIQRLTSAPFRQIFVQCYVWFIACLGLVCAIIYCIRYLLHFALPPWIELAIFGYCFLMIVGTLLSLMISYRKLPGIRQRQQWRIFVVGIMVACLPVLLLTVFPLTIGLPQYAVDGQVSSLSFAILPLALGYSLLRYQILLLEVYVRRFVFWVVSIVCLALLSYLTFIVCLTWVMEKQQALMTMAAFMALGCPLVLWLAHLGTTRIFSGEMQHYHRLLAAPHLLATEQQSLEEAACLVLQATSEVLETTEVALFILGQDRQSYTACPSSHHEGIQGDDAARRAFIEYLAGRWVREGMRGKPDALPSVVVHCLAKADRPLLINEVLLGCQPHPRDVVVEDEEVLFAPVSAQGSMVGVLVIGRQVEQRPYSGPDLAVVGMVLAKFAPPLATARMLLEVQRSYARQKEIDRLKDQFIMTASHELRTPLTAVQGYLELLAENWSTLDEDTKRIFVRNAALGCDELATLVNHLMKASQTQTEVERLQISAVCVADEVGRVLAIVDASFQIQRRLVQVDIPPQFQALADSSHFRQVLLNLFSNALKYSPQESPLEISANATEKEVIVRIRDYGSGIPADAHQEIFSRFVRMERDLNSPVRGTGLGLAISKQLIEAMAGRIWVESTGQEGQGSTFIIALPRVPLMLSPTPAHSSLAVA